jgi:hypothetical protein
MDIAFDFPIMIRCVPARCRVTMRTLVMVTHIHDIPELSLADTETALRARKAWDTSAVVNYQLKAGRTVEREYELRTWCGRLFRPLFCNPAELARDNRQGLWEFAKINPLEETSSTISIAGHETPGSLLHSILGSHYRDVYPSCYDSNPSWWEAKDDVGKAPDLTSLRGRLRSLEGRDLEAAHHMHRAICERLILIDGQVWFETKPPSIVLDFGDDYRKHVTIHQSCMPDILERGLGIVHLPLGRSDEIAVFLERHRLSGLRMSDLRVDIEADDLSIFDFDFERERVWRLAGLLTEYCHRTLESDRVGRLSASDAEREIVMAAEVERAKTNMVTGDRGTPEDHLATLVALTLRFHKTSSEAGFYNTTRRLKEDLFTSALDLVDNRAIDIHSL